MSLDWKCELCGRPKHQPCAGTLTRLDGTAPEPLPGRVEHYARALPPGSSKAEKRNEALI
jgi:hypothetical protein